MKSALRYLRDKLFFAQSVQHSTAVAAGSPPIPDFQPQIPRVSRIIDSSSFPKFPLLPKEIRQQIWSYSIPGPRVLLVRHRVQTHENNPYTLPTRHERCTRYTTTPASYGGHQPAILHVNQESRNEALRYLTPLWGTYWNLELDAPYFELQETYWEIKNGEYYNITALPEMTKLGELDRFKNIAIDWTLWAWETETSRPGYQIRFGHRLNGYEHPIMILNSLSNIKCCTFVLTNHPHQDKLVINPYVPWRLGPLTWQSTLHSDWEMVGDQVQWAIESRKHELMRGSNLEIRLLAIHDRERQFRPGVYVLRGNRRTQPPSASGPFGYEWGMDLVG